MLILIHSSKTMRSPQADLSLVTTSQAPQLLTQASILAAYLKTLDPKQLANVMQLSYSLAVTTHHTIQQWNSDTSVSGIVVESFIGDIYSGLQVKSWSEADRKYANQHLRILSGLYGILRPLDLIQPYRLEPAYKLPNKRFTNLYRYWGDSIAATLPADETIVNLTSLEYGKLFLPYRKTATVIAPVFLTVSPRTQLPIAVTVHTKIARGAFARWMVVNKIQRISQLPMFNDLNYIFDVGVSTPLRPVYVCQSFGGLGLSTRLK